MDKTATYTEDVFIWSRRQAELLRDLARAGVALPNELDLPNIAEEIEGVGLSELNSVRGHLTQALIHLIKAASSPAIELRRKWLDEVDTHRAEAAQRFTPGMRQHIDLAVLWQRAMLRAGISLARYDEPMAILPETAPFDLEELLADAPGAEALLVRPLGTNQAAG